jgi:hypothetical protein
VRHSLVSGCATAFCCCTIAANTDTCCGTTQVKVAQ